MRTAIFLAGLAALTSALPTSAPVTDLVTHDSHFMCYVADSAVRCGPHNQKRDEIIERSNIISFCNLNGNDVHCPDLPHKRAALLERGVSPTCRLRTADDGSHGVDCDFDTSGLKERDIEELAERDETVMCGRRSNGAVNCDPSLNKREAEPVPICMMDGPCGEPVGPGRKIHSMATPEEIH